jgi:AraC-like DNA-binding protein
MSMTLTDRCKIPPAFWRAMQDNGIPASALLRQARLPASLHLGGRVVTTSQYFALMRAVETLAGEPAFGIRLVRDADTSTHPPSSLSAFYARDYRDGLERLARFKRLCAPEILTLHEEGDGCAVQVHWVHAAEVEPAVSVDITFTTLVELGRRATAHHIVPRRVEFCRAGPKDGAYREYFGLPVEFGASANRLTLDRLDLDRPFPGHNPELLDLLTPSLGAALNELDDDPEIAGKVVSILKRFLPSGRPDLAHVAHELGMSDRTLQRRINEEGKSYRNLLVEARRGLGRTLLADEGIQIDEVAFLLGYQDTSSFYRAFRGWEGVSPSRWRNLNGRAGAALN